MPIKDDQPKDTGLAGENVTAHEPEVRFFEKRPKIYPKDSSLKGRFRKLKWLVMGVLLAIYYFTPFLRWDRGPNVPDQAVLIDMHSGRGYFFMFEIWPQEVYVLTGLLVLAAVGLFFVTSLFGRVWCGYACPQTVWTDLFVKVEHLIQGDRNARMKLDAGPWTAEKIFKKTATHFVWLLIGLCTGGAWIFYFADAPTLLNDLLHFRAPMDSVGWMIGLTLSTYFMAGYARENICTYACPYARFQSAMFDRDTLIINYDTARGEPRGKHKQGESWDGRGHCIDCRQCVVVCPVGIDIRNGLQLQCIGCGLCVDACDSVMDKIGLPRGLVRYDTENNMQCRAGNAAACHPGGDRLRLMRPRTIFYTAILGIVGGLVLYALLTREPFDIHALHDRNPLFVRLSDGSVRNNYTIKLLNKTHGSKTFRLSAADPNARLKVIGAINDRLELTVDAEAVAQFRLAIDFSAQNLSAKNLSGQRQNIILQVTDVDTGRVDTTETQFIAGTQ